MSRIIDRRLNGKNKSAVNRQRFLKRYRGQIKEAVKESVAKRSITDMEKGETITIPKKNISEPMISHGQGGDLEQVHPGNKEFVVGDSIPKPQSGGGQGEGGDASNSGEGDDQFVFTLSREEFMDIYFQDLELPDLIKKELAKVPNYKYYRAGVTTDGVPTNLNIVRSMRQASARRMALSGPKKRKLKELEKQLETLLLTEAQDSSKVTVLQQEIEALKQRIKKTPFIDTIDMRFNNRIKKEEPSTQAVMFCVMDVSGSMDEIKKDIAKRFFTLLYLFLTKNYKNIELVFIRHHTSAKEVNEEEFFYSRETGGTVVSSALELVQKIISQRYPTSEWNIYVAQASDGDNWNADSPYCQKILRDQIMPYVQYFAYVEILPRHHQSLWEAYASVAEQFANFSMQNIDNGDDIYPVFRELFQRKTA